jgi:hypothetical protein
MAACRYSADDRNIGDHRLDHHAVAGQSLFHDARRKRRHGHSPFSQQRQTLFSQLITRKCRAGSTSNCSLSL